MKVLKCFLDFDKEEAWLADMSRKGYKLKTAGNGYYNFDYIPNSSGDYSFKIDYRTFHREADFKEYCTIFEDSGWLHISGTRWTGSQYFVRIRPDAGNDIFSDNLSRAGRYKRISTMWLSLAVIYFATFLMIFKSYHILDIDELYLTPGLWEMKGGRFLSAFLFETPFALMRLSGLIFFIVLIAFYAYYAIKSYKLYKRELKEH